MLIAILITGYCLVHLSVVLSLIIIPCTYNPMTFGVALYFNPERGLTFCTVYTVFCCQISQQRLILSMIFSAASLGCNTILHPSAINPFIYQMFPNVIIKHYCCSITIMNSLVLFRIVVEIIKHTRMRPTRESR